VLPLSLDDDVIHRVEPLSAEEVERRPPPSASSSQHEDVPATRPPPPESLSSRRRVPRPRAAPYPPPPHSRLASSFQPQRNFERRHPRRLPSRRRPARACASPSEIRRRPSAAPPRRSRAPLFSAVHTSSRCWGQRISPRSRADSRARADQHRVERGDQIARQIDLDDGARIEHRLGCREQAMRCHSCGNGTEYGVTYSAPPDSEIYATTGQCK
jgi:hypothetical protein